MNTKNEEINVDPKTGEILDPVSEQLPVKTESALKASIPKNNTSLVSLMASRWGVDQEKLLSTLKQTAFKQKTGEVTNEQMMALLVVCNEYQLNPFLKQIYAYPDKNGIVPVVGIDGWIAIACRNKLYNGAKFTYSDEMITMKGSKPCPAWCEVTIFRKDISTPLVIREYLDEVYRELDFANPWKTHPKRFLRHKTLIQGLRIALGLTGIYDEDEASRIIEGNVSAQRKDESNSISTADRIKQQISLKNGGN